eukprot:9976353-Lingulodinium_polyedra.AAC.1
MAVRRSRSDGRGQYKRSASSRPGTIWQKRRRASVQFAQDRGTKRVWCAVAWWQWPGNGFVCGPAWTPPHGLEGCSVP